MCNIIRLSLSPRFDWYHWCLDTILPTVSFFAAFSRHYFYTDGCLRHLAWGSLCAAAARQAAAMFYAVTGHADVVRSLVTDRVHLHIVRLATLHTPALPCWPSCSAATSHVTGSLFTSVGFGFDINCGVQLCDFCASERANFMMCWRLRVIEVSTFSVSLSRGMIRTVHVSVVCDQPATMSWTGRDHGAMMICLSVTAALSSSQQ